MQRLVAPVNNGAKLLAVGFASSMLGVLITNALVWIRTQFSSGYVDPRTQNPLKVSAAYATYMATSSNIRYQVVAGLFEERGIEVCSYHQIGADY
jgi:hypothetical protein